MSDTNREDLLIPEDAEIEVKLKEPETNISVVEKEAAKDDQLDSGEKEGIESLRSQLEEQKRRAAEIEESKRALETEASRAIEEARKAKLEANTFRSEVEDSRLAILQNSLEAAKSEELAAKQRYANAMRDGDWDTAAEQQSLIGRAAARIVTLESGEAALRERLEQNRAVAEQRRKLATQQQTQPSTGDRVTEYISRLTPRSAEWVRARPEYVTDPQKNARMMAAHYQAVGEGIAPDTDQYFAYLDARLTDTSSQRKEPVKDQPGSSYSAPVSREKSSSSSSVNDTVIRLSPQQREAARIAGISDVEYARNLHSLRKSGRLSS